MVDKGENRLALLLDGVEVVGSLLLLSATDKVTDKGSTYIFKRVDGS